MSNQPVSMSFDDDKNGQGQTIGSMAGNYFSLGQQLIDVTLGDADAVKGTIYQAKISVEGGSLESKGGFKLGVEGGDGLLQGRGNLYVLSADGRELTLQTTSLKTLEKHLESTSIKKGVIYRAPTSGEDSDQMTITMVDHGVGTEARETTQVFQIDVNAAPTIGAASGAAGLDVAYVESATEARNWAKVTDGEALTINDVDSGSFSLVRAVLQEGGDISFTKEGGDLLRLAPELDLRPGVEVTFIRGNKKKPSALEIEDANGTLSAAEVQEILGLIEFSTDSFQDSDAASRVIDLTVFDAGDASNDEAAPSAAFTVNLDVTGQNDAVSMTFDDDKRGEGQPIIALAGNQFALGKQLVDVGLADADAVKGAIYTARISVEGGTLTTKGGFKPGVAGSDGLLQGKGNLYSLREDGRELVLQTNSLKVLEKHLESTSLKKGVLYNAPTSGEDRDQMTITMIDHGVGTEPRETSQSFEIDVNAAPTIAVGSGADGLDVTYVESATETRNWMQVTDGESLAVNDVDSESFSRVRAELQEGADIGFKKDGGDVLRLSPDLALRDGVSVKFTKGSKKKPSALEVEDVTGVLSAAEVQGILGAIEFSTDSFQNTDAATRVIDLTVFDAGDASNDEAAPSAAFTVNVDVIGQNDAVAMTFDDDKRGEGQPIIALAGNQFALGKQLVDVGLADADAVKGAIYTARISVEGGTLTTKGGFKPGVAGSDGLLKGKGNLYSLREDGRELVLQTNNLKVLEKHLESTSLKKGVIYNAPSSGEDSDQMTITMIDHGVGTEPRETTQVFPIDVSAAPTIGAGNSFTSSDPNDAIYVTGKPEDALSSVSSLQSAHNIGHNMGFSSVQSLAALDSGGFATLYEGAIEANSGRKYPDNFDFGHGLAIRIWDGSGQALTPRNLIARGVSTDVQDSEGGSDSSDLVSISNARIAAVYEVHQKKYDYDPETNYSQVERLNSRVELKVFSSLGEEIAEKTLFTNAPSVEIHNISIEQLSDGRLLVLWNEVNGEQSEIKASWVSEDLGSVSDSLVLASGDAGNRADMFAEVAQDTVLISWRLKEGASEDDYYYDEYADQNRYYGDYARLLQQFGADGSPLHDQKVLGGGDWESALYTDSGEFALVGRRSQTEGPSIKVVSADGETRDIELDGGPEMGEEFSVAQGEGAGFVLSWVKDTSNESDAGFNSPNYQTLISQRYAFSGDRLGEAISVVEVAGEVNQYGYAQGIGFPYDYRGGVGPDKLLVLSDGATVHAINHGGYSSNTSELVVSPVNNFSVVDPLLRLDPLVGKEVIGAKVSISEGFSQGDRLEALLSPSSGVLAEYDAVSGSLNISGTSSRAEYESILQSVRFSSDSGDPGGSYRRVHFQLDGEGAPDLGSRTVQIARYKEPSDGTRWQDGTSDPEFLMGSANADVLDGGAGNDVYDGGAGADAYLIRVTSSFEHDVIRNFDYLGGDKLYIDGLFAEGESPSTKILDSRMHFEYNRFGDTVLYIGEKMSEDNFEDGRSNVQHVITFQGLDLGIEDKNSDAYMLDFLMGRQDYYGANESYLEFGSNSLVRSDYSKYENEIRGDQYDNYLLGSPDSDRIFGLDGNDELTGGSGNDGLTGGSGGDRFVFAITNETQDDLITDFSFEEGDVLDIRDLLPGAVDGESPRSLDQYIHFTEEGQDTVMLMGDNLAEDGYGLNPDAPPKIFHTVTLRDADLTDGGSLSDQQVIKLLLDSGHLQVD